MYILGLNAYHGDAAACIFHDGVLIAASEEERFRRIKHWAGFPSEAIRFCLEEAGISIEQVDYITISRDPYANFHLKVLAAIRNRLSFANIKNRMANLKKAASLSSEFCTQLGISHEQLKATIVNVEHHRSHLASAFFASPFEQAALLSVDGFGDYTSTMTGTGSDHSINVLKKVNYPHSLGVFYTAFTQYLGFPHYGDEYKVMGLAPYGSPKYLDKVRQVIHLTDDGLFKLNLSFFKHTKEGVNMSWSGGSPFVGSLYAPLMEEVFGARRTGEQELTGYHRDLAASVQAATEEVIFHMLTHLHKQTGLKNLCLAGGVAQNSVANGKIIRNTPFEKLYIPPAGHDAGTSLGSAMYLYHHQLRNRRTEPAWHGYYGSKFADEEIEKLLKEQQVVYTRYDEAPLVDLISDKIIEGKVIGWFQGRAEFGPRALGHRSILADPRRADAKEILNLKIKRRESFRPFAPSILKEFVADFFEQTDDVPFMEKVFQIRESKRPEIPAVTHVDGSGRLQTVDKEVEARYYNLIHSFYKKTGVPILLNTSFNENEPIVNTPQQALDCYLRTQMDVLVLGNFVIQRTT